MKFAKNIFQHFAQGIFATQLKFCYPSKNFGFEFFELTLPLPRSPKVKTTATSMLSFFAFLIVFKWLCSGKNFWNLISLVLQTIHFSWNTSVNTKRWCISGIILLKCWEKHFIGIVHVKVYYIMFPFLHREITSTCSCSMDHRPWTRWPWTNRPVKKRFDWFWPLTEFYLIKVALVSKVCERLYRGHFWFLIT